MSDDALLTAYAGALYAVEDCRNLLLVILSVFQNGDGSGDSKKGALSSASGLVDAASQTAKQALIVRNSVRNSDVSCAVNTSDKSARDKSGMQNNWSQ